MQDSTIPTIVAPPVDPLAQSHRIAFVIDSGLDRGASANRCAVLATGIAHHHPEIIGSDLTTADAMVLPAFTKVPIVVLAGRDEPLRELAKRARDLGCTTLVFLSRAHGMRSYDAYQQSVAETMSDDLDIDAVALFGPKKSINRIVGSLSCLR